MLLSEMLDRSAQTYPDNAALIFHDEIMTYAQLNSAVNRLAVGFAALGIQPGDRVALLLPNCPPFVLAYYAAARLGAVAVPANPLLKPAELAYIWRDSGVKSVLTTGPLLPGVQAAREGLPQLRHVVSITSHSESASDIGGLLSLDEVMALVQEGEKGRGGEGEEKAFISAQDLPLSTGQDENGGSDNNVPVSPSPLLPFSPSALQEDDCAVIIYTSGTTGYPKGAMLSHRNLTRNVEQVQAVLHITPQDRFLTILPLFHSFAGTICMNLVLANGAAAVLLENFSPGRTFETIERRRVTVFPAVPAIFNALLNYTPERDYDVSSLRLFASGGAPLPASTLAELETRFHIPVLEGDGPTECSPATSVNPEHGPRKVGSVGPPLPGVEIAIWDEEDRPQPAGAIGEIVVRGDNVMLGYLNQPEATREAMRNGWYHTGDLGYIDSDGYVFIVDRKKDMIITAGLNVYPREVEEALFMHPAVADVAVIGQPDSLRGEEVVAVVVVRPGTAVAERELIRHCRDRLANYKVPRRVLFRESLPRGGTGKVVKRLLKKEMEMEAQNRSDLTKN